MRSLILIINLLHDHWHWSVISYTTTDTDDKSCTTADTDDKSYTATVTDDKSYTITDFNDKSYTTTDNDDKSYTTTDTDDSLIRPLILIVSLLYGQWHWSEVYYTMADTVMPSLILYVFFWVFPRRQIVVDRRFGTLCQFHLQRLDVDSEVWRIARKYIPCQGLGLELAGPMGANYNLTPGKYPKEYIQYSNHGESLKSSICIVCFLSFWLTRQILIEWQSKHNYVYVIYEVYI